MSEQLKAIPSIKVMSIGEAVETAVGTYGIRMDDPEAELLATGTMSVPSIFATGEALVCGEAIHTITPAMDFLEACNKCVLDPLLPARLVTVASLFPRVEEIAINISEFDGFMALRGGGIEDVVLIHWIHQTEHLGICKGFGNVIENHPARVKPAGDTRMLLPSDLLYACAIINTYMAIGATQFVLRRDYDFADPAMGDDRGQFVVAYNDRDYPTQFFGSRFPIGGKV